MNLCYQQSGLSLLSWERFLLTMDIAQPVQKDELFWILNCFQVRQELADIQAKRALSEAVMGESKQLKEIGDRAAELAKVHASLVEELQRRYTCPGCGVNNMPGLEEAAN